MLNRKNCYRFNSLSKLDKDCNTLMKSEILEQRLIAQAIMDWHKNEVFEFRTSGSTGIPKSISFSKDQVKASINQSKVAFNLSPNDTALISLPMRYVAGKMMLYRALQIGMNVVTFDPKVELEDVIGESVSFAAFVPQQIDYLIESRDGRKWLESIRIVLVGGSAINFSLEAKLMTLSNEVYHTYGMTETLTHIAVKKLSQGGSNSFSPLPNVSLSVSKENTLVISAHHLGVKLETNDVVRLNEDQSFLVFGRIDNVINSGALKIHPENLESIFRKYIPNDLIVLGVPDERWGEKVVLVIESTFSIDPEWIMAAKSEIPRTKWPKQIKYVNKLPRTESGKVIRKNVFI